MDSIRVSEALGPRSIRGEATTSLQLIFDSNNTEINSCLFSLLFWFVCDSLMG